MNVDCVVKSANVISYSVTICCHSQIYLTCRRETKWYCDFYDWINLSRHQTSDSWIGLQFDQTVLISWWISCRICECLHLVISTCQNVGINSKNILKAVVELCILRDTDRKHQINWSWIASQEERRHPHGLSNSTKSYLLLNAINGDWEWRWNEVLVPICPKFNSNFST